jgi:pyruvate/2-oxoglutarate/acetoin dehydrogenase E1 component
LRFVQAIRSDNPIIFFEHVLLYNVKGETHDGDYCQSLEKAEMVREGTDVSIFTYSRMRYVVMQAVAELEKRGYNPEVRRGRRALARASELVMLSRVTKYWSRVQVVAKEVACSRQRVGERGFGTLEKNC